MRTKLFLSLLIGLFLTVGVSAKNPETTTFSNVENTATGSIKEFTTFTTNTNEPLRKSIYKYDMAGNVLEKTVYDWAGQKGWIGLQKLEYTYGDANIDKPTALAQSKWDGKTNTWSNDTKIVNYSYNSDGTLLIDTNI